MAAHTAGARAAVATNNEHAVGIAGRQRVQQIKDVVTIRRVLIIEQPQQKRRREAMQMQAALKPGDEIVTIGGLHATVVSVDTDVVTVEIAPGVNARYARPAIARVVQPSAATAEEPEPPAEEPEVQSPIIETRKSTD